jgi:hypothetical protein
VHILRWWSQGDDDDDDDDDEMRPRPLKTIGPVGPLSQGCSRKLLVECIIARFRRKTLHLCPI